MNIAGISTSLAKKNILILGSGVITRNLAKTLVLNQSNVEIVTNLNQKLKQRSSHSEFVNFVTREEFLLRNITKFIDVAVIAARPERWGDMESISDIFCRLSKLAPSQVILLSSSSVYGDSPEPFVETSNPKPASDYGKHRLKLEVELTSHFELNKITVLRISNVFGHPNLGGVIESLAEIIQNTNRNKFEIDFDAIRDYIYLEDLVQGIILSIHLNMKGYFNLSSGVGTTVREIFGSIPEDRLKSAPRLESTYLPDIARCVILKNSKFGESSHWYPKNPLRQIVEYLISPYIEKDFRIFS